MIQVEHETHETSPRRRSTLAARALNERLLVVSAASKEALAARLEQVAAELRRSSDGLADLAFTLARGRRAMAHRAALVLPEAGEVPALAELAVQRGRAGDGPASVAFMFPGQGAQFIGMGRALHAASRRYRDTFERCEAFIEPKLGFRLRDLLLAEPGGASPALEEKLMHTAVAQPALFVVEYALADLLMSYGVRPALLLGHSIGEFVAACLAGVFELEAALELVCERGRLMGSMPPGAMLAVKCEPAELENLLGDTVSLAAHNAPGLSVVSGPAAAIELFQKAAEACGLEHRALHTSHAFHSSMMEPILGPFRGAVERARPRPPRIPIVSTMTGARLTDAEATSPEYWSNQLRNPVRFAEAATSAADDPARVFVEVGPGVTLVTSVAKLTATPARWRKLVETLGHPKTDAPASDAFLTALGALFSVGASVDWDTFYEAKERKLVRLPTYPYRKSRHFIEPPRPQASGMSSAGLAAPAATAAAATADASPEPGDAIAGRLRKLLEARLGRALTDDDLELRFLDLGFDSLALSQLGSKLRQEFLVEVPIRLLFDRLGTPQKLGEHLLRELPESRTQRPASAKAPVPAAARAGSPDVQAFDARLSHIESLLEELRGSRGGGSELRQPTTPDGVPVSVRQPPVAKGRRIFEDGSAELTSSQSEIWVAARVGGKPANLAYNECRAFLFGGELDEAALLAGLRDLWSRHSALRQTFSEDGERCITHEGGGIPLEKHELRAGADGTEGPESARFEEVRALMNAEVSEPFDLTKGPLIRGRLITSSDTERILVLSAHHVVVDGSSWEILIRELAELYSAHHEGRAPKLPPAQAFSDYLDLDDEYRKSGQAARSEAFWVAELAGQSEDLNLPTDRARPLQRSYASTRIDHQLGPELVRTVREVAAKAGVTTQTFLMAAFEILLARLSRQEDFVCGVPTSGQAAVGMDSLVGHFVHVLPVRCRIDPGASVRKHVLTTQQRMLDGLEHQRATFTEILPKLSRPRDPSRPALVQVAFGMGRSQKRPRFSGVNTALRVVPRVSESFELYVYATDNLGGLEVSWSYNTDLFDAATIERWQRCFVVLVEQMVAGHLDDKIKAIALLSPEDRNELITHARGPHVERAEHLPVHLAFAAQARKDPERVSLIDNVGRHSYRELDQRANRIAHALSARGVGKGALVAVCLERNMDLVAALLAVWRAGAGYVPLDPAYPPNRIQTIVEDSRATLVLTASPLRAQIPGAGQVLCLDELETELRQRPATPPPLVPSPDATAYVIFTSGSTGRPKGVEITQGAFENFAFSMLREPGFTRDDCILALTTVSFDISGLELFLPLVVGGRAVVVTKEEATDPKRLARLIVDHDVTVMQATPATWQMMFDSGWRGYTKLKVLCGGEAFPRHLAEKFLESCGEVWNVYGPTETTVWSTVKRVTNASDITIGRPIDNTTLYVLDEARALVPLGAHGELWIGGDGVARGYLGRKDLTEERFVTSPFEPGERLYRTGDLARLRGDGEFECLGRADFQVKIRGFRIELGEVETALLGHPTVKACVVVASETKPGEKILAAYVVPESSEHIVVDALRAHVESQLPAYMVPSAYIVLDALPMTPNKKVDRKALPAPVKVARAALESTRPTDKLEGRVLALWKEMLGHDRLGTRDNFYSVGGQSLMAIRLMARINSEFGVDLPVTELFTHPTVEGLSKVLRARRLPSEPPPASIGPPSQRTSPGTYRGLFCIQEGMPGGVPLFLVHGDMANGLVLPRLGEHQEVWGYHHQGSNGERIQFHSVVSLAKHAHGEWVKKHKDRPCVLAGHSFGALVAYQIAVIRQAAGLETPRVVIIDARHPSVLGGRNSALSPRGVKARLDGVLARRKADAAIEKAHAYLDRGEPVPSDFRPDYIVSTYSIAASRYDPPQFTGNLDVIRSAEFTRRAKTDNWELAAVGKVRRTVIDGSHLSIVRTAAGIEPIAQWLRQIFDELHANPAYRRADGRT